MSEKGESILSLLIGLAIIAICLMGGYQLYLMASKLYESLNQNDIVTQVKMDLGAKYDCAATVSKLPGVFPSPSPVPIEIMALKQSTSEEVSQSPTDPALTAEPAVTASMPEVIPPLIGTDPNQPTVLRDHYVRAVLVQCAAGEICGVNGMKIDIQAYPRKDATRTWKSLYRVAPFECMP